MLRRRGVKAWATFIVCYAVGAGLSALIFGLILIILATPLAHFISEEDRRSALIVGSFALAALDLLGRTPKVNRQTPQQFARELEAGPLGLVYGLDIGSLFSTIRVTSLSWILLLGIALDEFPATSALGIYQATSLGLIVGLSILVARRPPVSPAIQTLGGKLTLPFRAISALAAAALVF